MVMITKRSRSAASRRCLVPRAAVVSSEPLRGLLRVQGGLPAKERGRVVSGPTLGRRLEGSHETTMVVEFKTPGPVTGDCVGAGHGRLPSLEQRGRSGVTRPAERCWGSAADEPGL